MDNSLMSISLKPDYSKRLIESNLIGGPTSLPILNDLAPPLKIQNVPCFYYGFGLRESEGDFLLDNILTWAGFLRLIQYVSYLLVTIILPPEQDKSNK